MATSGGASALQGKFSELDPIYLYQLIREGKVVFDFIVNHAEGKIFIQSGPMTGGYLTNEDLIRFEDPIYSIINMGIPKKAGIRTPGYTAKTAAERANEFRRRDPEGGNPFKKQKNETMNSEMSYKQLIKYFGLENIPKDKVKNAVRRLTLFFKNAYNLNVKMNADTFDNLKSTILPKIIAVFPINQDAMAFRSHENFIKSAKLLTDFLYTFRGNNSSLYSNSPTNLNEATGEGTELDNIGEGGGAGMNEATGEGTELENVGEGGGSGMGGGRRSYRRSHKRSYRRRRRQTKRRSVKARRTRRSRN